MNYTIMQRSYTLQEVALVPQFNNVASRTEPDLGTWLTKKIKIGMPLLAANMDTVIGPEMAECLNNNDGMPIFHRFCDISEQLELIRTYGGFGSIGLNHFDHVAPMIAAGAKGVCIDIAHGHSESMLNLIKQIKREFPDTQVIAGNICTPVAYHDLVSAGADACKVGIGCGANCTTRIKTGFGVPQFTAVKNCANIAKKLQVPLIADGGITDPRDMVVALAAGASTVMMGSLFGKTESSPAPKELRTVAGVEKLYCRIRGQASKDFQTDFYGSMKKGTVEEGVVTYRECTGSTQDFIDEMLGSLRSALTYGGARNIKELQKKAEFVITDSASYMRESKPRNDGM